MEVCSSQLSARRLLGNAAAHQKQIDQDKRRLSQEIARREKALKARYPKILYAL
jgi:hypothetical protein